jgi:hypothetical protein
MSSSNLYKPERIHLTSSNDMEHVSKVLLLISCMTLAGALDDQPPPRSHHTLTSTEHACLLVGGSGALGPSNNVFLLESPAVTSGLQQQHRLLELRQALAAEQGRGAELRGMLRQAALQRDRMEAQQQVFRVHTAKVAECMCA